MGGTTIGSWSPDLGYTPITLRPLRVGACSTNPRLPHTAPSPWPHYHAHVHDIQDRGLRCGILGWFQKQPGVTAPARLRETLDGPTISTLPSGAETSVSHVWTIQRQRPSTLFTHLPSGTVNSVRRYETWNRRSTASPGQSRRTWSTPSVWDTIRLQHC